MGSCFAEHIGKKLAAHKVNVCVNPNGIVFNPISIFKALSSYAEAHLYTEADLVQHNNLWYSWQHHGSFAHSDKTIALQQINTSQANATHYLTSSDYIVLTFGSAFIYEFNETNELVANCHKVPQQAFTKRLLSVKEIITAFEELLKRPAFANKKFIFTISPVRYIRDGLVENNHSKAILLRAVHELVEQYSNLFYFPAYEIVIDELRDYRFFEKDMVHPNQLAIDYVWERFSETLFDDETKLTMKEISQIMMAKEHRSLHPDTSQHKQFLKTYLERTKALAKQYPFLQLDDEMHYFSKEV